MEQIATLETTPERLEALSDLAGDALREVRSRAESLRHALDDARRRATQAVEAMEAGKLPDATYSFGPIGHQTPFDIAKASAELTAALNAAASFRHLGLITNEQIDAAYAKGAKGFFA